MSVRIAGSVLRSPSMWLAPAATVVLIAGCGTSASVGTSSPSTPITAAQALAYAHAVNLRASDVPEMISSRNAEVVIYPHGKDPFLRCAGVPAAKVLLEIHSTIFGAPYWWMRSTVGVLPTNALAAAFVSALGSSRGRRCMLGDRPLEGERRTVSTISVGAPFVGFRTSYNTGRLFGRSHEDFFAFASGRAVLTLTAEGERTPSVATERRVLWDLYRRAEANKL